MKIIIILVQKNKYDFSVNGKISLILSLHNTVINKGQKIYKVRKNSALKLNIYFKDLKFEKFKIRSQELLIQNFLYKIQKYQRKELNYELIVA